MTSQKNVHLVVFIVLLCAFLLSACVPQVKIQAPELTATSTPKTKNVLRMWNSDSPTTLNPHLSRNIKDLEPSRIVYEPLAVFDKNGNLIPVLAAEIPSRNNGELPADGTAVIWKLRPGLRWSDGEAFSADDVVFTYNYITDPYLKASTAADYAQISTVTAVDKNTVKITFKNVTPAWSVPFVGNGGVILPKHIFGVYKGASAREAPANTMPVGTGPYRVKEPGIKPQEVLLLGSQIVKTIKIVFEPNPYYRSPEKIAFDQVIFRGGGTVTEAARSLFQEGSLDVGYAFDSIDPAELSTIIGNSKKGKLVSAFGSIVTRVLINQTDPLHPSADQEYSSLQVPHPFFKDKKFRQAIAYAINRDAIAGLYGGGDQPTSTNLIAPPQYRSSSIFYPYDLEKAKQLLEEDGITDSNGDGFREKDGQKIKLVFQSAVNSIQQQAQKIIQQDLKTIGIDTELKIIDSSIMFGAGALNPDSAYRFNADMMIFQIRSLSPDPSAYMGIWKCSSVPQKANNWTGLNFERWCNSAYDTLLEQAKAELDPVKRQNMFIQLNNMLVEDVVMIPVVWRASAMGINEKLSGLDPTPWDSITWNIQEWHFTTP